MYKKITEYFKEHVMYNAVVHILLGVGLGILITYPIAGQHPVRWALVFLVAAAIGHVQPILGDLTKSRKQPSEKPPEIPQASQ